MRGDILRKSMTGFLCGAICLAWGLLPGTAGVGLAQALDPDFDPGADGMVLTLALQPDGKVLAGGHFGELGGLVRNGLGRLNPDGNVDEDFDPDAADEVVRALAAQVDGKVLVAGDFTEIGGQPRSFLARLNPDGTVDEAFDPSPNGIVHVLIVLTDGRILLGGEFTSITEQPRHYLARLNPDGSLDTGFNPGANGPVMTMAVQTDGKILVGGTFTTLAGQPRNNIGRLNPDGSLDVSFNPTSGSAISALVIQADGKILVGGSFKTISGQIREYICRLNGDGSLDMAFNPGANGQVSTLALQADGRILVGGWFTSLAGESREFIGRLNADGSLDTSFNPGANSRVAALAIQEDGKVLVGGMFSSLAGQERERIGRLSGQTALQNLAFSPDGKSVSWMRSGGSPELWGVTFEFTTDGESYTMLGAGSRIGGGWRIQNLVLPRKQNLILRARGYYNTGFSNNSTSLLESFDTFFLNWETNTGLTSSLNPSIFGDPVTFTAQVTSPDGLPAGEVTFSVGQTTIAVPLDSAGQATYTTSSLPVGNHVVTATYGGDHDFSGSTSDPLIQTVNPLHILQETSLSLTSSSNPSVFGEAVTFTAEVSSSSGLPTGEVTFSIGQTTVKVPLNSAKKAIHTTSTLPVGDHVVLAAYTGDDDFTGSVSLPLIQKVIKESFYLFQPILLKNTP
jgi:uncharacterized delta-60 repeat protein